MIQLDVVRQCGVPDFKVIERKIISGPGKCVWYVKVSGAGEFVLIAQEQGSADAFLVHPNCLPPEVKAARRMALDLSRLAQDRPNR